MAHMTELVKDWPETHKGQAVLTAVIQRSELLCMRDVALRDSLKQPPFSTCVQKLLWLVRGLAASWAAETHQYPHYDTSPDFKATVERAIMQNIEFAVRGPQAQWLKPQHETSCPYLADGYRPYFCQDPESNDRASLQLVPWWTRTYALCRAPDNSVIVYPRPSAAQVGPQAESPLSSESDPGGRPMSRRMHRLENRMNKLEADSWDAGYAQG